MTAAWFETAGGTYFMKRNEDAMKQHETKRWNRLGGILRTMTLGAAALLVPLLLAAAVAPALLLLIPVVIVASLFVIAALIGGSRAAHQEERRRACWRPSPSPVPIGARSPAGLPSARAQAQRLADGALRVPLPRDRRGPTSVVLASPALIARAVATGGSDEHTSDGEGGKGVEPGEPHVVAAEHVA